MHEDDIPFFGVSQEHKLPEISNVDPAIEGQRGRDRTILVANQTAREFRNCGKSLEEYAEWMRGWNLTCEPPWDGEGAEGIEYWITDAWEFTDPARPAGEREENSELLRVASKNVSFRALNKIAFTGEGQYDQFLARIAGNPTPNAGEAIDRLYPGNPLLCRAAKGQWWAYTDSRESIRGVEEKFEWLVPSPMRFKIARNQKGEPSVRCRENAANVRSYLVIEFDFTEIFKPHIEAWAQKGTTPKDVQIALVYWLATTGEPRRFPFMIVDSGGKSLHYLFAIGPKFPETAALALLSRAIPLGADPRGEYPEQFFRFPGGTRSSEKNQPQPILFYDESYR